MPQSSQLPEEERQGIKLYAGSQKSIWLMERIDLWRTSSSLVRSNSLPLSLNIATWCGPSLNVTCTEKKNTKICQTPKIHFQNKISRAYVYSSHYDFFDVHVLSYHFKKTGPIGPHVPWQENVSSSLQSPWERSWPGQSSPTRWFYQHSDPQPQPPERAEGSNIIIDTQVNKKEEVKRALLKSSLPWVGGPGCCSLHRSQTRCPKLQSTSQ